VGVNEGRLPPVTFGFWTGVRVAVAKAAGAEKPKVAPEIEVIDCDPTKETVIAVDAIVALVVMAVM
jgi:hypothetical protein